MSAQKIMLRAALWPSLVVAILVGPETSAQDHDMMATPVIEFQFRPLVGEGWREYFSSAVELSWLAAGAESTVVDSVVRIMDWEVLAETDSGYIVRWTYGPQEHFMNGEPLATMIGDYLFGKSYALLVEPTGRAVLELDQSVLDSFQGLEPSRAQAAFVDTAASQDSTEIAPPEDFRLIGIGFRDWNARLEIFYDQEWGQAESVFEIQDLALPGGPSSRLFIELWLESVSVTHDRPVARIEARQFTTPSDSLPVDDVGFLEFLEYNGIDDLYRPKPTDVTAAGKGTWYLDPQRLLLYQGSSVIRGVVPELMDEKGTTSVRAEFEIRRYRRAEPIGH